MLINEIILAVVGLIIAVAALYVLFVGGYRAFRRHWILAIIALFVGGFFIWALVEMFIEQPAEKVAE